MSKIEKSIFLNQYRAAGSKSGIKIIRGMFLTTYSLLDIHIWYCYISRAKICFSRYFLPKKCVFQIDEIVSEHPKISKFPRPSLYTFLSQNSIGNPMQTLQKWLGHGKIMCCASFDSSWQHFDPQHTYFDVFLMCLPYSDHHDQNLGGEGVYANSKK